MYHTNRILIAFGVVAIGILASAKPPPALHRILIQEDSPIKISSYDAKYQARGTYRREGILHSLKYQNHSDREIVAVKFGLLSFNIFNQFQDRLGGVTIEDIVPGRDYSGSWVASALAEFAFYTGVAYVDTVRFRNGEIWISDRESILSQIQEIEQDFDAAQLTDK